MSQKINKRLCSLVSPPPSRFDCFMSSSSSSPAKKSPPDVKEASIRDPSSSCCPPSLDPAEVKLRRRLPPSLPRREEDVYVTTRTSFPAQLSRCRRLIDCGRHGRIYLHSIGAAVPICANLALRIQKEFGARAEAFTDTVELTDDFEPVSRGAGGDGGGFVVTRNNSALHIRITLEGTELPQEPETTPPTASLPAKSA